jgi:WD40 repeat protein
VVRLAFVALVFTTVAVAQTSPFSPPEPGRALDPAAFFGAPPSEIVWRRELSSWTYALNFSANGAQLVALHDGTLSFFDAADATPLGKLEPLPPRGGRAVALSATDTLAVTAGTYIDLYDLRSIERLDRIACSACNLLVRALAFSPDGRRLALQDFTTGNDRTRNHGAVRVVDLKTKKVVAELEAAARIPWVSFSRDGRKLLAAYATGGGPGEQEGFRVWDTADWRILLTAAFPGATADSMATGAVDGSDFAVHGNDGNIEMRDLTKDVVLWSVPLVPPEFELLGSRRMLFDKQQLRNVAVAPNGSFVVSYEGGLTRSALFEGAIVVRRARDGATLATYHVFDVTSLAIAPDSRAFAFTFRLDETRHQMVLVRGASWGQ